MMSAPDRRELVRYLIGQELSERRSLAIAGMSASAFGHRACGHGGELVTGTADQQQAKKPTSKCTTHAISLYVGIEGGHPGG